MVMVMVMIMIGQVDGNVAGDSVGDGDHCINISAKNGNTIICSFSCSMF